MEKIDGIRVKDFLNKENDAKIRKVCFEIGRLIGKLHSGDLIHGDLTTSNMIIDNDTVYFIDFSLGDFSKRLENKGVDMNLLSEALKSTHFKNFKICWDNIVKGYKQEYNEGNKVLETVKKIEKRARYVAR